MYQSFGDSTVVIRGRLTVRKLDPGHFSRITVQHTRLELRNVSWIVSSNQLDISSLANRNAWVHCSLCVFFIGLDLCTRLVGLVRIRDREFLKHVRAAIFAFACSAHTSTFFSGGKSISLLQVPRAPITNGNTVIFMFHRFFSSLARSR